MPKEIISLIPLKASFITINLLPSNSCLLEPIFFIAFDKI